MTINEAKMYLHEDSDFEDEFIYELIETSQLYIDSMVGESYKTDPKAVKLAQLVQKKLMADMYDQRSTEIASASKKSIIVTSILDKLSYYSA